VFILVITRKEAETDRTTSRWSSQIKLDDVTGYAVRELILSVEFMKDPPHWLVVSDINQTVHAYCMSEVRYLMLTEGEGMAAQDPPV